MSAHGALVAACAAVLALTSSPTVAAATVELPPTSGGFDYQLGGPSGGPGLTVVARDSTDAPLPGAYNICYLNGFQTQPGSGRDWLTQHGQAVLRDTTGAPVIDPDWPDEYILDPSHAPQRATILEVLTGEVNRCADNGFDAVEIDNLDTFTRYPSIDRAGALELARGFVALAHERGLAIGQKNAAEITASGKAMGFDFAVAEECAAYDECGAYTDVYGSHVLQIEYADNLPAPFTSVCAATSRAPLTILRDRELRPEGTAGHIHQQCR